ncbi:MAG: SH3 domain-containing protein [Synechococcales cyanobacterium CRU_2_2]|nr:SH3 domain-containing protein [Synechococcales cyanobacterium CRU_2_2]
MVGKLIANDSDAQINVRVGPGENYRARHYGVVGDQVEVLDAQTSADGDQWHHVRFVVSGADGWVHEAFVEF